MKKTLIALAVLTASAASFAQSSVTISGVMDFAAGSIKNGAAASESTVSTTDLTSATSVLRFIAVEDLGGGMKATAQYNFDPRALSNDTGSNLGRDELFVGLSGGFGNIRLGSPNSIGLTTFLSASPLGTGIGSGYGVTAGDYSNVRYDRSARYDSPTMNGFAVAVLYAPGANAAVSGAVTGTSIPVSVTTGVANEVTELGLTYNNGPLSLGYANITQAAQPGHVKSSVNILAARYTIGATVLSAGWNDGDLKARGATTAATTATDGYRVGVAHTMGAVTLLGSHAVQKLTASEETVTGLRADYALSKRTVAYVGYENYENAVNADRKTTSIGVRHAF